MRSKKDSIALFGTSADPPTLGHQALLKDLATIFPKVITWASDNPDKTHGISLRKRSQLLRTLVKEISLPQIKLVQDKKLAPSPRPFHSATETLARYFSIQHYSGRAT